jgi:hypothetical protein
MIDDVNESCRILVAVVRGPPSRVEERFLLFKIQVVLLILLTASLKE